MSRAAALLCLLLCLCGAWSAARSGLSRLLSDYGSVAGLLPAAEEAIRFSPNDPEAYYSRAVVLSDTEQYGEAVREFERAVALRPRDYFLWLELGRSRDQTEDLEGAREALRRAVELAPHYAQPRWQLGNLLLRAGQSNEAFAELRRAASSDPALFPAVVDLAWGVHNGDAPGVERAVEARTPEARLMLARFFVEHGKASEAMRLFDSTDSVTEEGRRALLSQLLARKLFKEAFGVWSRGRDESVSAARTPGAAAFVDGGFESEIRLDDPGFGWQLVRQAQAVVRISLDRAEPRRGARSLRIDFTGGPQPSKQLVSQLVLVEPGARYRLSFAARTRELVTGGPLIINVLDAGGDGHRLAQSKPLPRGESGWQTFTLEFEIPKASSAVTVTVQRQTCPGATCPVFGSVWLDDFLIESVSESATEAKRHKEW